MVKWDKLGHKSPKQESNHHVGWTFMSTGGRLNHAVSLNWTIYRWTWPLLRIPAPAAYRTPCSTFVPKAVDGSLYQAPWMSDFP